jgi:hypothetical protein
VTFRCWYEDKSGHHYVAELRDGVACRYSSDPAQATSISVELATYFCNTGPRRAMQDTRFAPRTA